MRSFIQKDDYIGFTYAGIHSSQFGIKSVSGGDRYQRYLSPEFTDTTAQRVGANGTHYFGTNHTRKVFNFNIAFDDMTEVEFRELKGWLNSGIQELILDELPYVKYYAKIQNIVQIGFLAFLDDHQNRVLKGEFALSFVCYDPYGYSTHKWAELYDEAALERSGYLGLAVNNVTEWVDSSRLLYRQHFTYTNLRGSEEVEEEHHIDTYISSESTGFIEVYNGGDLDSHFILEIPWLNGEINIDLIGINGEQLGQMKFDFSNISQYTNNREVVITIDTYKRLVYIKDGTKKIPYNSSLKGGNFFTIPITNDRYHFNKIVLYHGSFTSDNVKINYDYRYL